MRKYPDVWVSPEFCLILALGLFLMPIKIVLGWLIAVLVHEIFHYFAFFICSVDVTSIRIGISGVSMMTPPLDKRVECLCAAAGPLGSFLCISLFELWPIMALCATVQLLFNLMPLYPMDGGRILLTLLQMKFGNEKGVRILLWIQYIFTGLLLTILILLVLVGEGSRMLLCFAIVLTVKTMGKMTCKHDLQIVQ